MKSTVKHRRIYRLKNVSMDEVVETYLKHHHADTFRGIELEFLPTVGVNTPQPKMLNQRNESRKTTSILHDKFTYLIHLVRNRQLANGGGYVPFSSVVLQTIFGKDYNRLLQTLMKMELISCDNFYDIGSKSYGYRFNDWVEFTYTLENINYLSKYSDKATKLFTKSATEAEQKTKKELDNNLLYDRYNQSLKLLKLTYCSECEKYLSLHNYTNNLSRDYHYYLVDTYLTSIPSISSVDKNRRIYSIATSTPRIIKPFLNIKFSCDIHNSHPLLFNNILFDYYNVPLSLRKSLSSIFSTLNISPHNVRRNIRNTLIECRINRNDIASIPADVLAYIYITSIGRFWDVVIPSDNDDRMLLRTDIKVLMFAEVFYSKKLTTRGQKYAKIFKAQFPNVYKVVRKSKESDRTKLANDMMRLESSLFHEVLMKLYNKRSKVVSIHDAIVVLDVKANEDCTVEVVKKIICDIYNGIGLHPDVSVDYYGKELVDRTLANEEKANRLIEDFKRKLSELCESGDEEAAILQEQLNRCEMELLPNADYTEVLLHPLKIR